MNEPKLIDWENEFDRRSDPSNYTKELDHRNRLQAGDMLLDPEPWPESKYELDGDKVKNFIANLLKQQAALTKEETIKEIAQFKLSEAAAKAIEDGMPESDRTAYISGFAACQVKAKQLLTNQTNE